MKRTRLQWRSNERDGVLNHRHLDCFTTVLPGTDQLKTLKISVTGLCEGIHRWLVISPHKWPLTWKIFPFDYVIMRFWLLTIVLRMHGKNGLNIGMVMCTAMGLYPLRGRTSYHQISWSLEAARLDAILIVSLWSLTSRQSCCRDACQISERLEMSKSESSGFESSRNLTVRRPSA